MSDCGDRLAALERYGEMLEVLTPAQLCVVALRLEGLNQAEIGEALGITRKAVHLRLRGAARRLRARYPDLDVEGRRRRQGYRRLRGASATAGGE